MCRASLVAAWGLTVADFMVERRLRPSSMLSSFDVERVNCRTRNDVAMNRAVRRSRELVGRRCVRLSPSCPPNVGEQRGASGRVVARRRRARRRCGGLRPTRRLGVVVDDDDQTAGAVLRGDLVDLIA